MWDTLIIAFVVSAVMGYLTRSSHRAPEAGDEPGSSVLRYGRTFAVLGWLGILAALGVVALAFYQPPKNQGESIWIVVLLVAFGGVGAYLLNESRAKVVLSAWGIRTTSPWRGEIELEWSEVDRVGYSGATLWFTIRGVDRKTIRIHSHMQGSPLFLDLCRKHLPREKFSKAEKDYLWRWRENP